LQSKVILNLNVILKMVTWLLIQMLLVNKETSDKSENEWSYKNE
jgi:hypothetical protein